MKNRSKALVGVIIGLSLLISIVVMCVNSREEKKILRVNVGTSSTSATTVIIKEYRLLEKYLPDEYTIEWSYLSNPTDIRDALISDKLDISQCSVLGFATAVEKGIPFTIISNAGSTKMCIYGRDDIETINNINSIGLKDHSSNSYIALLAYCKEKYQMPHKLDDIISIVPMAESLSLMRSSNSLDASVITFPTSCAAEEMPEIHMLADLSDVIAKYAISSIYIVMMKLLLYSYILTNLLDV